MSSVLTGASLDEVCLLTKVTDEGVASFNSRTARTISIKVGGQDIEYEIIQLNEFTSERKIMSTLVREKDTGRYFSFVKGAES